MGISTIPCFNINGTIFKTITSSVDESKKTLALFDKDWNTYKTNWQNANGISGKIGSIFSSPNANTSAAVVSNDQVKILRNWNNAVKHGCTNQETFNRIIANADENTKMYFAGLNKGKGSIEGLKNAQKVGTQSTIGLTIAQTALNMAITMGITALASIITKGYDELANSVENCKKRVDDLMSSYKSTLDTANNNANRAEELADKYEDLSKGVNSLGENVSLTNEEYEEYNSLVNEIADMFPTLVQGYTAEGNAILNLKGNVEQLRSAYKEAQQEAYNLLIVSGEDSDGNDIIKQWEDTHETGFWSAILDLGADDVGGSISVSDALEQLRAIQQMSSDEYREIERITGTGSRKEIAGLTEIEKDIGYGSYLYKALGLNSNSTDEEFGNAQKQARALIQTYNAEIESALSDVKTLANAYLMTNEDYDKLDEQSKTVASLIVNSLNADDANNFSSKEDVAIYVDEIVQSLSGNEDVRKALVKLFTMDTTDMPIDEIQQKVDEYVKTVATELDEDPVELKTRLGFDNSDTELLVNKVKGFLNDEFDNKVGGLTLEELDIASNLEISEGTLLTWDELIAKIKEVQSSTSDNEVDVSLDKYKSASDSISSLATAYKELSESEYVSLETISKIKEAVGDSVSNWDAYEQKLMSVKKGTAEYNQLMSELTYATLEKQLGGINALAQADEKYVAQLLKENGVLNANAVAQDMVALAKAKLSANSKAQEEITEKNINSILTEATSCAIDEVAYKNLLAQEILFGNTNLDLTQKISSLRTLAGEAMLASGAFSTLNKLAKLDVKGDKTDLADSLDISYREKEGGKKVQQRDLNGNLVDSDKKVTDLEYEYNGNWYDSLSDVIELKSWDEWVSNFGEIKLPEVTISDSTTSPSQSFKESFNWIETALSRIQNKITSVGKTVAATWQSWKVRNAALKEQISAINKEISLQEQAYSKYMALAESVGLSEGYKALVREGAINIETIESESIAEAIKLYQEYYEKALAAKDASADLKDELAALAQTKFSNLAQSFADLMSGNEHTISMYEATIDLMEKKGYSASASLYDSLKEAELKNQGILKEKYQSLSQALDEAVSSGTVVKYSKQWYQMQNEILAVEQAILQSNIALAEYDNALRDLEWSAFDKLHEKISEIYEETEFLDKLLSDEKKFNEDGSMTEAGQAALGLHAVNYKMHLAQAEEYAQELERIKEALAKDPYNQALLDRQDELEEKHREALTNARDDEQAMIDTVSEGYDTLLDYMDKMIDNRKNMLSQAKDLYEYEKNISKQTKEITSLEKQLAAYQGDDSEEARATIQKLQVSLSEAKDNLEETEYDKYISDQEEMLDTLRLQTEEWINARLDNEEQLLKDIVSSTEKNATMIKDTLSQVVSTTGATLSEAMKNIWSNDGDIGKAITEIKTYLAGMQKNADEKANEQTANNIPAASGSGTTAAPAPTSSTPTTTTTSKWGDFFIKKSDSYPKGKLNKDTSIMDRLKYLDFDSSFSARSQYYTAMGGSGVYTGSSSQNRWMIAPMKAHSGFARGGIIGDMIRAAGEDGIALVRKGEGIIPTDMMPQWEQLIQNLQPLNQILNSANNVQLFEPTSTANHSVVNYNTFEFNMPNVTNGEETITYLQHSKRFENIIHEISFGKNSLSKYKY